MCQFTGGEGVSAKHEIVHKSKCRLYFIEIKGSRKFQFFPKFGSHCIMFFPLKIFKRKLKAH